MTCLQPTRPAPPMWLSRPPAPPPGQAPNPTPDPRPGAWRRPGRHLWHGLGAAALLCATGAAMAHDSWLSVVTPPRPLPGRTVLALSTGAQFPVQETAIAPEYLRAQGCRALAPAPPEADAPTAGSMPRAPADAASHPMAVLGLVDTALLLALPSALASPAAPAAAASCWLQTSAFELDLDLALVPVYLDEVRPSPEVLALWRGMRARGLPWRERYVKHARIELPGAMPPAGPRLAPQPAPLGLDLVLDDDPRTLRTDRPLSARLLRDGQPLADHAVELRNERLAVGIWLKTDAQGRLQGRLPLPGRWLLRAIDLRLSNERPDTFDSRFITLALSVAPPPAPAPSAPAATGNAKP